MPRTSLRRLSTLAAVRAAAAARRAAPVEDEPVREREESTPAEEGKRRVYTCRRGKEKSLHQGGLQFGRGSGLLPRSHPPATPLAGSEPFCITLYHPQAHLEQSLLLLLFYDFFGSHRSPLGPANKSKNQLLYLSCVLSNFIHPS